MQIELETLNGNLSSETNFPVVQMANLKEVPVFQSTERLVRSPDEDDDYRLRKIMSLQLMWS